MEVKSWGGLGWLLSLISVVQAMGKQTLWRPSPPPMTLVWEHEISGLNNSLLLQEGQPLRVFARRSLRAADSLEPCYRPDALRARPSSTHSPIPSPTPSTGSGGGGSTCWVRAMVGAEAENCSLVPRRAALVEWASVSCGPYPVCSAFGACLLNAHKREFECLCCDGSWRRDGACRSCAHLHRGGQWDAEEDNDTAQLTALDDPASPCDSQPCLNGAVCVARSRNRLASPAFLCLCPEAFSGRLCEIPSQATCDPSPCPASSHCFITGDEVECVSYAAAHRALPHCERNFCSFGGACFLIRGTPRCVCKPSYAGLYCQRSVEAVGGGGGGFLALTGFVGVFFAAALFLLVCNCHQWTCQISPASRRRGFDTLLGSSTCSSSAASSLRRKKSPSSDPAKLRRGGGPGLQMYALDDSPETSSSSGATEHQPAVTQAQTSAQATERDFLVSHA